MNTRKTHYLFFVLVLMILISAMGVNAQNATPPPPTATPTTAFTSTPTNTYTPTQTFTPSATPTMTPSATCVAPPAQWGRILTRNVDLVSQPLGGGTVIRSLQMGQEFSILFARCDAAGNWAFIELADGFQGWIPEAINASYVVEASDPNSTTLTRRYSRNGWCVTTPSSVQRVGLNYEVSFTLPFAPGQATAAWPLSFNGNVLDRGDISAVNISSNVATVTLATLWAAPRTVNPIDASITIFNLRIWELQWECAVLPAHTPGPSPTVTPSSTP